jgi:hypothetical protein
MIWAKDMEWLLKRFWRRRGGRKRWQKIAVFLLLQYAGLHNIYVEVFLRNRLTTDENVIKI